MRLNELIDSELNYLEQIFDEIEDGNYYKVTNQEPVEIADEGVMFVGNVIGKCYAIAKTPRTLRLRTTRGKPSRLTSKHLRVLEAGGCVQRGGYVIHCANSLRRWLNGACFDLIEWRNRLLNGEEDDNDERIWATHNWKLEGF